MDYHIGDLHSYIIGEPLLDSFQPVLLTGIPLRPLITPHAGADSSSDREIEILQLVQQTVLEHAESITAICEQAAVLDWYHPTKLAASSTHNSSSLAFCPLLRQVASTSGIDQIWSMELLSIFTKDGASTPLFAAVQ
jgi:hypothetical protein